MATNEDVVGEQQHAGRAQNTPKFLVNSFYFFCSIIVQYNKNTTNWSPLAVQKNFLVQLQKYWLGNFMFVMTFFLSYYNVLFLFTVIKTY